MTNTTDGGIWSSSNELVAVIGTNGIANAVGAGNTTISYTVTNSCGTAVATKSLTVNPTADAGTITGTTAICLNGTTALSNSVGAGVWSSTNTAIATITPTGVVTGKIAGIAPISYTVSNSCGTSVASIMVTISTLPSIISGTTSMCMSNFNTLIATPTGGVWSTSNTAIATTNSDAGTIYGISAGTTTVTYNKGGCIRTAAITVKATPAAITGNATLCVGQPLSVSLLSNTVAGGTWASSNSAKLAVSSATGLMKGMSAGTATVTYKLATGCYSTATVTINAAIPAITGGTTVCMGSSVTLANATSGGTWSSSNSAKATINTTTGAVTGIALGSSTITYNVSAGCYKTIPVAVNVTPSFVTGTGIACQGLTTALTATPGGGAWTSSNTSKATVASGIVKGISAGTAIVTYRMATGCLATREVTVNALPAAITGTASVCTGNTTVLSSTTTGGTWTSAGITKASVNATDGTVAGIAGGTAAITYTLPTGCYTTRIATVNVAPVAITGTLNVCTGAKTTLTSTPTGGTWSSSNTAVATMAPNSGIVTGIAAGTSTIVYTNTGGCTTSKVVTVNQSVTPITGTGKICLGQTFATSLLSNATPGGVWSTTEAIKIAVNPTTGLTQGLMAGTAKLTYTAANGCSTTSIVTVNAAIPANLGTATVCQGANTTLANTLAGGTWSSSNTSVASINPASGIVTGITTGTAVITYGTGAGCYRTSVQTVNASPAVLTGAETVTTGSVATITSSVAGGAWSSNNTAAATINSAGVVSGVSAGSAMITYKFITGCFSTRAIAVVAAKVSETIETIEETKEAVQEEIKLSITVYPNPTSGAFTVEAPVAGTLTIFSIDGKVAGQFAVTGTATTVNMPFGLTAGMYMCQFVAENGRSTVVRLAYRP
jgi:uncharacterized protein YjdB